jgi:hypothetical protein
MQAFMAQQEQQTARQQQQMAAQQQQMQALQEQHEAQVQGLQNALAQTNEAVQALRRLTPAPESTMETPVPTPKEEVVSTQRTKAILPNPPKFNGSRSEYEGWRSLIKDKIEVDGEVIGSDRNRFIYVASRLEGKGL